jgi:hypothetical protein
MRKQEKPKCDVCGGKGEYVLESGVVLCEKHIKYGKNPLETKEEFVERVKNLEKQKMETQKWNQ